MSASLVGSEMCIRDRLVRVYGFGERLLFAKDLANVVWASANALLSIFRSVSYTHLTLPTICSV
eukprot:10530726-Alexandrium_andersonii.AAC.1